MFETFAMLLRKMARFATVPVLVVCTTSYAYGQVRTSPTCAGRVRGQVVDADTGEPVPDALVTAGDSGAANDSTTSDEHGRFQLVDVCGETTSLSIERADYQSETLRAATDGAAAIDIALDPHSVTRLDDVIVEALAIPRSETRSSTTLNSEALERTRGRDLAGSIAQIPGVSSLGTGATAKPIIRGQFGRRLLILVDGVRHENQKWALDHAPEIDPFAAGSITVVKGAGGVRYGPDAIGGVILIEPHSLPTVPGVHGELFAIGTTNSRKGTLAGRVESLLHVLGGDLSWRVAGNIARGAAPSTPDYALDNTGIFEWNASAAVAYAAQDFDLKLSFRRNSVKNGQCGCIRNDTPGGFFDQIERGEPLRVENFTNDYEIERAFQDVTHDALLFRARADVGSAGTATATYSYQVNDRSEFDVARASVTAPQADFNLRTHTLDLTLEHAELELGAGLLSGTVGASINRQEQVFRGLVLVPNYRNFTGGVFAFEQLAFEDFQLSAGARYDRSSRTSFLRDQLFERHERRGTLPPDPCEVAIDGDARCEHAFDGVSASVGGVWLARQDTNFKLDLSVAQRFPFVDEQYINGSAPTFPVIGVGDPSLGNETTLSASFTGLFQNDWLFAELSVYGSRVNNYIYFAPDLLDDGTLGLEVTIRGSFPRFTNRAIDASFYGADGGFRVKTPYSVDLEGQFSVVRGSNRSPDTGETEFLVLVPSDRVSGSVSYRAPSLSGWTNGFASLSGSYVSRQDRVDLNADFAPPPAGYFLLGASAGAERLIGSTTFRASVQASNLLNQRYRNYTSLLRYFADEPGPEFFLRTSLSF